MQCNQLKPIMAILSANVYWPISNLYQWLNRKLKAKKSALSAGSADNRSNVNVMASNNINNGLES
jgi:hypothetical protein